MRRAIPEHLSDELDNLLRDYLDDDANFDEDDLAIIEEDEYIRKHGSKALNDWIDEYEAECKEAWENGMTVF